MTGSGKAFGKLDANVKKGMTVEKGVEWILKALALKRHQIVVASQANVIFPRIAFASPFINGLFTDWYYKKQLKTIDDANKNE